MAQSRFRVISVLDQNRGISKFGLFTYFVSLWEFQCFTDVASTAEPTKLILVKQITDMIQVLED